MTRKPLYIETLIDCDFEKLWDYTQLPELHQRWDLRFSKIKYLPKEKDSDLQLFEYSTNIGFGVNVFGVGESVGTKTKANGESTSVLKFSSDSNISLIETGSGYWKYKPKHDGIKFYTGYDYKTRWGLCGKVLDKFIFRPLMIWATAVSFDCLKKWIENGVAPQQSYKALLTVLIAELSLSIIWIYQGLIPKLLFPDSGELDILKNSHFFHGQETKILVAIGILEIIFGIIILLKSSKTLHYINLVSLFILGSGALFSNTDLFILPFNPFSLNVAMAVLSTISLINLDSIPKSNNCITK